jgi:hypothetical protein
LNIVALTIGKHLAVQFIIEALIQAIPQFLSQDR